MTRAGEPAPWRLAVSMFTVIPVRAGPAAGDGAARAVLWLPAVGGLVAVPAVAALLAVEAGGAGPLRRLLAAVAAVAVLALLTGGLHLDGLADMADGLASRRPPEEALAVMRRGDTGPLGAAALVLILLVQATSLATLPPGTPGAAALAVAAVCGRAAVARASGPAFPPPRPVGFGALVAGRTSGLARVLVVTGSLATLTVVSDVAGGVPLAWRALAAAVAGLAAGDWLCRAARLRLGGVTGDVFGAVIEVTTAVTLLVLAVLT